MTNKKIVVLISGNGSNLQAIIDAVASKQISYAEISLVVSNRKNAYGLERAQKANIPTLIFTLKSFKDAHPGQPREDYDKALAAAIMDRMHTGTDTGPDLVVLAGWMHILSPSFLDRFPKQVINLHPAMPNQFDGANAIERAYAAFKNGEITGTGVMVHYVIPAVDKGEVIRVRQVEIKAEDTLADLEQRIHIVEHSILVEAVQFLLSSH